MEGILNKSHAITAKITIRAIAEVKEISEAFVIFLSDGDGALTRRTLLM
jgi:Ca2+-binding EF-hand superfamily protein